ncbi:probable inactive ATP-dependent zinc metalloprotease FTSHI 2, chloroplastic [Trifolium pratense]|uniref:probable inactive ATP-dependent zinc metalloprotease FTSHI 2, chloroplastic n=1 Tax=Trifolium pratense TaxID=57577 RepID=UPI001E693593|nr:probable inactive ATP-dependent zinc metalloprotease FTSHI 2, chloroplastic [Trifolium pratense]
MSSHCLIHFPPSSTSPFLNPKFKKFPKHSKFHSISSQIQTPETENEEKDKTPNKKNLNFLKLSVTLTVISASLPQSATAVATVTEKKRTPRKGSTKKVEALTPEELKSWIEGIPVVTERIPYTEIIELKNSGKLKHIVKSSAAELREHSVAVLVVLEDSRVLRTVLPSIENDGKFWSLWDELKVDSLCMNAYTPPVKNPEIPLPVLYRIWVSLPFHKPLVSFVNRFKPKKKSKKELELGKVRMELQKQKKEEVMRKKREKEMIERNERNKKREEETRKRQMRKKDYKKRMVVAKNTSVMSAQFWTKMAKNKNVINGLGVVFFLIFYRTVVYSYKKQKKDYEDRVKIQKADAEERKKIREMESEMGWTEAGADDDESEPGKGEENPYLRMTKQFMKSGARVRRAQNKRLPQYLERGVDVKFTDVAGLGKIRLELEEIVKFFTHGEMYRRRGVKIPGGILLCGPPGVGKTLLAKAVAGEAGVNFFSISASQFVEIYVGVGASRVRSLYQEAKENAPSVVFIDELDAVGRKRGLIKGSGGQERDATLNQLLVCLDGFEGKGEVITIASTNRPDILDPALVRPGRFDRKIFIPKPGVIGRIEILKVHARKKPVAEDIDYEIISSMTDGMVGAELANIVEVAAINMMRESRTEITTDDLLQAAQMEERGMLDRKERSKETWEQVALNEVAMAVAAMNLPNIDDIEYITIAPRAGRELGYVRAQLDSMNFNDGMLTRQSLFDHITVQLAPRAADEIWFGKDKLSTIWAETADNARVAARMYMLGGLSEKHHGVSNFWLSDRINEIDLGALKILNLCYERAKEMMQQNRTLMDAMVNELVEKKSLIKEDIARLVQLHGLIKPKMPISILDIRDAKRRELQEVSSNGKETEKS